MASLSHVAFRGIFPHCREDFTRLRALFVKRLRHSEKLFLANRDRGWRWIRGRHPLASRIRIMEEGGEKKSARQRWPPSVASRLHKVHKRHAMRSGALNEEKEKGKKRRKKGRVIEKRERAGRPEVVDFAHNYNPASEILQFTDVARVSRHNDHDSDEARFMNMRIRLVFILGGTFCSAACTYVTSVAMWSSIAVRGATFHRGCRSGKRRRYKEWNYNDDISRFHEVY